jgi:hypothetical protein
MDQLQQLERELEQTRKADRELRAIPFTGTRMPPETSNKLRALHEQAKDLMARIGKLKTEQVVMEGPVVTGAFEDSLSLVLPRDVINYLLLHWEAGLNDQEHFEIASTDPVEPRMIRIAAEICKHLK